MSPWTTPDALRAQVLRRWEKGELLAERVTPTAMFPWRLALRVPSSNELSERFDEAQAWVATLLGGATAGYRVVMRDVRHRIIGTNRVPAEVWVDTAADAVGLIGKAAAARAFDALVASTRKRQPALLDWLQRQPLRALSLANDWDALLDMVAWMAAHPRPGIYVRQVDLPGIHSKFVEAHRTVLAEWFDRVLPPDAVDTTASGAAAFARRYGFLDKPARLRFRWLDPRTAGWTGAPDGDCTVSQATFTTLEPAVDRVFVTENEVNFLAFPSLPRSLVVFGAGYGFDVLARAPWIARCSVHYWGDIDTHGFAILDQLRAHHPHVQSFLMDRTTLLAHRPQWTDEPLPVLRDLPHLQPAERALYDDLRWQRLAPQAVRLEQERIPFGLVLHEAAAAAGG